MDTSEKCGVGLLVLLIVGILFLLVAVVHDSACCGVDYTEKSAQPAVEAVLPEFNVEQAEFDRTSDGYVVTFGNTVVVLSCSRGRDGWINNYVPVCKVERVKRVGEGKTSEKPEESLP